MLSLQQGNTRPYFAALMTGVCCFTGMLHFEDGDALHI